jgi:hypothetical protein
MRVPTTLAVAAAACVPIGVVGDAVASAQSWLATAWTNLLDAMNGSS